MLPRRLEDPQIRDNPRGHSLWVVSHLNFQDVEMVRLGVDLPLRVETGHQWLFAVRNLTAVRRKNHQVSLGELLVSGKVIGMSINFSVFSLL